MSCECSTFASEFIFYSTYEQVFSISSFQTSFQFITHQNERFSYLEGAYLALIGGCDWVQLRMKGATDEEVEPIARKLKLACEGASATFILGDRVELVKKLQIDGVHLGKNDMPVDEARKFLGDEFIIGGTANTFDDIRRLHEQGGRLYRLWSVPLYYYQGETLSGVGYRRLSPDY